MKNLKETIKIIKNSYNIVNAIRKLLLCQETIKFTKRQFENFAIKKQIMNRNWEIIKALTEEEYKKVENYSKDIKELRQKEEELIDEVIRYYGKKIRMESKDISIQES